jgi:hypothetical protein
MTGFVFFFVTTSDLEICDRPSAGSQYVTTDSSRYKEGDTENTTAEVSDVSLARLAYQSATHHASVSSLSIWHGICATCASPRASSVSSIGCMALRVVSLAIPGYDVPNSPFGLKHQIVSCPPICNISLHVWKCGGPSLPDPMHCSKSYILSYCDRPASHVWYSSFPFPSSLISAV